MADSIKILKNAFNYGVGINLGLAAPLDSRIIVKTKGDLTSHFKLKATEGFHTAYGGMMVTVADENRTYILKSDTSKQPWGDDSFPPAANPSQLSNWVAAGNVSEIYTGADIDPSTLNEGMLYIFPQAVAHKNITNKTYPAGLYVTKLQGTPAVVDLVAVSAGGDITASVAGLQTTVTDLKNVVKGSTKTLSDKTETVDKDNPGLENLMHGYEVTNETNNGETITYETERVLGVLEILNGYMDGEDSKDGLIKRVTTLESNPHAAISIDDIKDLFKSSQS